MKRVALLLSFASGILLLAPSARASEPFPETMQTQLGLAEKPLCTVCHLTLIGGPKTVTRPFGMTLMSKYGVTLLNVQGLRNALTQMTANKDDSDKDGVDDITELKAGTDPNVGEGGPPADEGPQFGCQFATGSARSGLGWAVGAWIAGVAVASRRRTARRTWRASIETPLRSKLENRSASNDAETSKNAERET